MSEGEGVLFLVLGFVLGGLTTAYVHHGFYRQLQVECGQAHYDTVTGEFIEHKKQEAK